MYRRTVDGQVLEFGTTGLLRFSNLVMYDRQTESWWQEFGGEAIVGDFTGKKLQMLPLRIVSWREFKRSHPRGKVLSKDTGHSRPYGNNPYAGYDSASSPFAYDGPEDKRLSAMERVVGIKVGDSSVAVPFSVLEKDRVVQLAVGGQQLVVFWEKGTASTLDDYTLAGGRDIGAATVFEPLVDGRKLSYRVQAGTIVDDETGSAWSLLGEAHSGPLAGKQLRPVPHSISFWFSWSVFAPGTTVYRKS